MAEARLIWSFGITGYFKKRQVVICTAAQFNVNAFWLQQKQYIEIKKIQRRC